MSYTEAILNCMAMVFSTIASPPPAPIPKNWHLLGRDFQFRPPTCGRGKSPRRLYSLRMKFQQKTFKKTLGLRSFTSRKTSILLERPLLFSSLCGPALQTFPEEGFKFNTMFPKNLQVNQQPIL